MQEQCATSELDDFDTVFRVYRNRVFRYIYISLHDRDAAETLTQDCFLKAYRARATFRGEAKLSTWLMRIARNLIRDHLRNRRVMFWRTLYDDSIELIDVSERVPDGNLSPEDHLLLTAKIRAICEVIPRLSPQQREVFQLRFLEQLELQEIAECTGLKEGTVKSHLYRALRIVREKVQL